MPGKMALVNYQICRPDKCENGLCKAALACKHKLLKQEKPFEAPMPNPSICRGCADCVLACPMKAIDIVIM